MTFDNWYARAELSGWTEAEYRIGEMAWNAAVMYAEPHIHDWKEISDPACPEFFKFYCACGARMNKSI